MKAILRHIRKTSGYAHGFKWEPGMDSEAGSNAPFKPAFFNLDGAPDASQADHWGGDLGCWEDALIRAVPGTTIDFYVSRMRGAEVEELETNLHVWLLSEREAWVCDCGGKPYRVTIEARAALTLARQP